MMKLRADTLWKPIDYIGCMLFGRRFVGANSVEGVLRVGEELKQQGYRVTYNLLGEHVRDEKTVDRALATTRTLISRMDYSNAGNISCKPTLYGLSISKDIFKENIGNLIQDAYGKGIEVEFDAENYKYIPDTFEVFSHFASRQELRNTVRQAVQAHLSQIYCLMTQYKMWDKNIRVVKGANVYPEDTDATVNNKTFVKYNYLEILQRNMVAGRVPFAATVRDGELAEEVKKESAGVNHAPFEFQMLGGLLGRTLGESLLRKGYPVRIYVTFVAPWCRRVWIPYGMRRMPTMRGVIWSEVKNNINNRRRRDANGG